MALQELEFHGLHNTCKLPKAELADADLWLQHVPTKLAPLTRLYANPGPRSFGYAHYDPACRGPDGYGVTACLTRWAAAWGRMRSLELKFDPSSTCWLRAPLHEVLPCIAAAVGPTLEKLTLQCQIGPAGECSKALGCVPEFANLQRLALAYDVPYGYPDKMDENCLPHAPTDAKLRALLAPLAAIRASSAAARGDGAHALLPSIAITIKGLSRT